MLFARAISNGAKFYCPDAFAGAPVYTPDELGAEIDPETGELWRSDGDNSPAYDPTTGEVIEAPRAPADTDSSTASGLAQGENTPAVADPEPSPPPASPATEAQAHTAAAVAAGGDPDAPVGADEVAKLTEVLDALNAPDSFRRMALMTYGVDDLAGLTRQQAAEVHDKALARFGG
jgi:hypothetical protein